jgi:protein-S-isoprenylcysteine O-methyltransferase Ste14
VTIADPYLIVRAASLYITVVVTVAVWLWRRPTDRAWVGAALGFLWNLPALMLLHIAATRFEWWRIDAEGGLLLGMPVELYLAWAWLWGAVPALAFPRVPLAIVIAVALVVDLIAMPAAEPVIRLGPAWLAGETVGLLICLLPSQLLARWTARDERLPARAVLQIVMFTGLVVFLLPLVIVETSGSAWVNPVDRPAWAFSLIVQVLAVPALIGLTAVQEFLERGEGTPVPFDPPRWLVTTGIYAFVRNPMQVSAIALLLLLGLFVENLWIAAAGVMAHIYSAGLAGWDEDVDLVNRFGQSWRDYTKNVRRWFPRLRPWYPPDAVVARLYVSEDCGMCRQVGEWFARQGALGLSVVAAERHPTRSLTRITYEPVANGRPAAGVEGLARAVEHIHFGWALLGFAVRLPILRSLTQLLADAAGAEPRRLIRVDLAAPRSTSE